MKRLFGSFMIPLFGMLLSSCGVKSAFYPDSDKYIVGNQTYSENVSALDIDWISGNVFLVEDETIDGVKIEEETDLTKEEELVHSYLNDGELKVKYFASNYRKDGFNSYKKDLTVTYNPGLERLKIYLTSGSCVSERLTVPACDIDITSGDVRIDELMTEKIATSCTSGSFEIGRARVNELSSDMTSGDFTIGFISVAKASFSMTSGTINMALPEEGGKVKVSKTSGTVATERETTIKDGVYSFGSGSASIEVHMTSGRINIS